MDNFIGAIIIGVVCIVLGIINACGNIRTLHSYHRKRVSEADKKPFARLVGAGTIISGVGIILYGGGGYLAEEMGKTTFSLMGTVALIACLVVGLGMSLYALIKYNHGIF